MTPTESFLRSHYDQTHWPYLGLWKTRIKVGESFDTDIRQLKDKGMVRPVSGVNGWMIEILQWNTLWNQKQE